MRRGIELYIKDIIKSIKPIEAYSKNITLKKFEQNMIVQDAIVRRLEIIGEAMNAIPREIQRKNMNIKWNDFINIRNFLTHVYFGLNPRKLFNVIRGDLPILKEQIYKLKREQFK